jgi:hypothetical protein
VASGKACTFARGDFVRVLDWFEFLLVFVLQQVPRLVVGLHKRIHCCRL